MFKRALILTLVGAVLPGFAQTETAEAIAAANASARQNVHRLGLTYRFPINVTVDFKDVGGFVPQGVNVPGRGPQPGDPSPAGTTLANRTYENGYSWVDSSTNAGGYTWFWGYNNLQNQAFPNANSPAGIQLQSSSSAETSINDRKDDMIAGFEVTYEYELHRSKNVRFGLEAGFGYNNMEVDTGKTKMADVNRITDSFVLSSLDYGQPLPPSYQGTFTGPTVPGQPGRLSYGEPLRTPSVIDNGAQIEGKRHLDADLFGIRLGPYVEFPITRNLSAGIGGGVAIVYVSSEFSYSETVSISGVGVQQHQASGHDDGWVFGGYASAFVNFRLVEDLCFTGGAQFQSVQDYTHREGGKSAVLRLGEAIFFTMGLSYSF